MCADQSDHARAREAHVQELLKVRARRDAYEKEKEEKEAKRIEDQRTRESELFGDWQVSSGSRVCSDCEYMYR